MYDLQYVKKRKIRKIAALGALFATIGVTSLVIVAFLGRTVGTFTISLKNTDVNLSLSEKKSFDNPSSYIRLGELKGLRETNFSSLPLERLDSEETPYDYGKMMDEKGNFESLEFIKCTFYVRNVGNSPAQYNLSVDITDRTKSKDETSRILDDTLRVMVFDNDGNKDDSHNYRVFAKEAVDDRNTDKSGKRTTREFVSEPTYTYQEDDAHPLAETFVSSKTVANFTVSNFKKGDVRRYTIVLWLEGFDPQSKPDDEYPEGATIKLGVNIAAYENAKNA